MSYHMNALTSSMSSWRGYVVCACYSLHHHHLDPQLSVAVCLTWSRSFCSQEWLWRARHLNCTCTHTSSSITPMCLHVYTIFQSWFHSAARVHQLMTVNSKDCESLKCFEIMTYHGVVTYLNTIRTYSISSVTNDRLTVNQWVSRSLKFPLKLDSHTIPEVMPSPSLTTSCHRWMLRPWL